MGTMLYARGVFINRCYDELNLSQPDLVREIHAEYLQAGAEVIETNTFGGNAYRLEEHGLKDKVREINLAGVRPARCYAREQEVWGDEGEEGGELDWAMPLRVMQPEKGVDCATSDRHRV